MKAKHSRKMAVRWLFLFVVFGLIVMFILNSGEHKTGVRRDAAKYSDAEVNAFHKSRLKPIFMKLEEGAYPIPEIQVYYTKLRAEVVAKFGGFEVNPFLIYDPQECNGADIRAVSCVVNGVPQMNIMLSVLMDDYNEWKATGYPNWEKMFEYSFVIVILHELEHIAHGFFSGSADESTLIGGEASTWAATCENVICPLVEKYGAKLDYGNQRFYDKWIQCGRDVKSPLWIETIRGLYGGLRPR